MAAKLRLLHHVCARASSSSNTTAFHIKSVFRLEANIGAPWRAGAHPCGNFQVQMPTSSLHIAGWVPVRM